MLIVEVAGLLVAEDFVGLRDGLELFVGFFALLVGDLVRVGCERGLAGVSVCSVRISAQIARLFTLWYAFLISALVAERWIFRTSMLVSDFGACDYAEGIITVKVNFLGHVCAMCVGVRSLRLRGCT